MLFVFTPLPCAENVPDPIFCEAVTGNTDIFSSALVYEHRHLFTVFKKAVIGDERDFGENIIAKAVVVER